MTLDVKYTEKIFDEIPDILYGCRVRLENPMEQCISMRSLDSYEEKSIVVPHLPVLQASGETPAWT